MAFIDATAQPEGLPIAHQKSYDGSIVVTHGVQSGESLARIAAIYHFQDWRPIWVYNTQVEKTIGDDPNLIRKGVSIFIPRSKAGYDALIKKLEFAKIEVQTDGDRLLYALEADSYSLEAQKVMIDFVSDVATTLATFALKARQAVKATAAAEKALGQAKIAARHTARTEGRAIAAKYAEVRARLVRIALEQHQKLRHARQGTRSFLKGKVLDTAADLIDALLNRQTGDDDGRNAENTKNVWRGTKIFRDVVKGTATAAGTLADVTDILLDYLEPSQIGEIYLLVTTGETTNQTYASAVGAIRASVEQSSASLDAKIARLKDERTLLYGGG